MSRTTTAMTGHFTDYLLTVTPADTPVDLTRPTITFRVPWSQRYERLGKMLASPAEHPFCPGLFVREVTFTQVPDAYVNTATPAETGFYDRVAEVTAHFAPIRFSEV